MTYTTINSFRKATKASEIFGPYSAWPRQPRRFRRNAILAGSVGSLAVFVHCVVPMIA